MESLYAATITDAETCHVAAIKEVAQVYSLQQLHREDMQNFEHEVLEKEEHTHLSFLNACGAALRACPRDIHGVLLSPLQLLLGVIPPASLLTAIPQLAPLVREPPLTVSPPLASQSSSPLARTKWWCHPSGEESTKPTAPTEEPTHERHKSGKSFMQLLKENCKKGLPLGNQSSSGHQVDVF